jgi:hypothetical protein
MLRRVLLADGLTSGLTGLGLMLFPATVARLLGVSPTGLIAASGAGLVLFGLFVLWLGRREPSRAGTLFVAAANAAWVLGSVVFIIDGGLTTIGKWAVALVAVVVLAFAVLQWRFRPSLSTGLGATATVS